MTKITLRLKSDPSVVLPEADLRAEWGETYHLVFGDGMKGLSGFIVFEKADWEPVPPPYTLPTGIGAVVEVGVAYHFVRSSSGNLAWWNDGAGWRSDRAMTEQFENIRTLSEGVEL